MDTGASRPPGEAGRPAHLLHVFPSFTYGGVPIRITGVINHFGRRYRHTVFALDGNLAAGSRLDPALGVRLADPGIAKGGLIGPLAAIARRLAAERPDLLLTYNWGAVEWALANTLLRRRPHIHFESGFGPEETDRQIPRRVWARRIALSGARALVVPSLTLVAIARDIWHLPAAKVRHIPNGVDCDLFAAPADPPPVAGFARRPGDVVVGTVAPLRAEKNIERLIRAFAAMRAAPPSRLLIAGDGPARPGLEALAAGLGLGDRAVFLGHVERPETVYPLMDVFSLTSDTEQMPNTLLQAMAAGRPVAAVDVGDVKALLPPDNAALVVPRQDAAGLTAVLDRLAADPALRRGLATANRNHVVAHYAKERMYDAYGALYDSALAPAARSFPAASAG